MQEKITKWGTYWDTASSITTGTVRKIYPGKYYIFNQENDSGDYNSLIAILLSYCNEYHFPLSVATTHSQDIITVIKEYVDNRSAEQPGPYPRTVDGVITALVDRLTHLPDPEGDLYAILSVVGTKLNRKDIIPQFTSRKSTPLEQIETKLGEAKNKIKTYIEQANLCEMRTIPHQIKNKCYDDIEYLEKIFKDNKPINAATSIILEKFIDATVTLASDPIKHLSEYAKLSSTVPGKCSGGKIILGLVIATLGLVVLGLSITVAVPTFGASTPLSLAGCALAAHILSFAIGIFSVGVGTYFVTSYRDHGFFKTMNETVDLAQPIQANAPVTFDP